MYVLELNADYCSGAPAPTATQARKLRWITQGQWGGNESLWASTGVMAIGHILVGHDGLGRSAWQKYE